MSRIEDPIQDQGLKAQNLKTPEISVEEIKGVKENKVEIEFGKMKVTVEKDKEALWIYINDEIVSWIKINKISEKVDMTLWMVPDLRLAIYHEE